MNIIERFHLLNSPSLLVVKKPTKARAKNTLVRHCVKCLNAECPMGLGSCMQYWECVNRDVGGCSVSVKQLWYKNSVLLAVLTASAMLTGCGEGSDSGFVAPVKPGAEQTQYYAQNVVRQSSSTGTFYVELSTNIGRDDGTKAALNQVTVLSSDADWRVVSQNNNGFTLK
ncbi:hypothetical protein K6U30_06605, partial [Vibrio furnissii]|nr:hypothetical protein [Vibrio furnissii]